MRLGPDGQLPPKKKRPAPTPLSRPAPALRNTSKKPKRNAPANPRKRKLTTRQHRLEDRYGDEYQKETGRELASNAGLMRALLEANLASAADLRDTLRDPSVRDLHGKRRLAGSGRASDSSIVGPSVTPGENTFTHRPDLAADFVRRTAAQVKLPPRGSFTPDEQYGFAYDVLRNLRDSGVTDSGIREQVVKAVVDKHPDWSEPLRIAASAHLQEHDPVAAQKHARQLDTQGLEEDKLAEAIIGGGVAGLATGGLRAAGLGLAQRTGAGLLGRGGAPLVRAGVPAARVGRGAPIASRYAAPAVAKLGLRDAVRPVRTIGTVAARSPLHAAGMGAVVAGTSPAAAELARKTTSLKKPGVPLDEIDNLGVAETAYAQGGSLTPQQKADIERQIGVNGRLIASQEARDMLLKQARDNGWNDNEHTGDIDLIQHAMIGAPSGARRFLGRAFQDVAALSDIPTAAQAVYGAGAQSVRERSAGPGLKMLQEGFVDPTLYAFQHPVSSFKANPVLTGTLGVAALRTAGGVGGLAARRAGLGPGQRHITLPGQGVVPGRTHSSNLVDRTAEAIHDRFLSSGNPESSNPIRQLANRRAVAHQKRLGTKIITEAQHKADVETRDRTIRATRALKRMDKRVADAFIMVAQYAPHRERPTTESYLQDFDHFIDGMEAELASTQSRLAATFKTGDRAGQPKYRDETLAVLRAREKTQKAALEEYRNLKQTWIKKKPKVQEIHEAAGRLGEAERGNKATLSEITGNDPRFNERLEIRPHLDRLAFDRDLKAAIAAEHAAELKVSRAAHTAHTKRTKAAQDALAAARRELEQARIEESRARHLKAASEQTPEQVATTAVAHHDTDKVLLDEGITPDSAGLKRSLQVYRTQIRQLANRRPAAQQRVEDANARIGAEIITKDDEHGIITGTTRGEQGPGLKMTKGGVFAQSRRGGASSRPSKKIVYEVTVVAKDGTHYRTEMGGVEAASAINNFDKLFGQGVKRGNAEKAGWGRAKPEHVAIVGENRHHLTDEPIYDFPEENDAPVTRLTKPASKEQIGVAKLSNSRGFGQRGLKRESIAWAFHVTAKHGDQTYTIPDAVFETVDEARAFARELDARMAERPEGHAVTNEAKTMMEESEAKAMEPDDFDKIFGGGEPEAPDEAAPVAEPEQAATDPRITATHIKQARQRASKYRTEAKRLRGTGERQAAASQPVAVKIPTGAADAMIAKLKKSGKRPELLAALEAAKTTKLHRSLDVEPALVPALRAELRALKTPAATKLAAKLPHPAGAARSAKAASGNLKRAEALERRAAVVEKRADEVEAARKAEEKVASGERAAGERSALEQRAADRTAAAEERLVKAEEQAAKAAGEKPPERNADLAEIEHRHFLSAARELEERGATPAFRPHTRAQEGAGTTFPNSAQRMIREDAADLLGGRLKRNDMQHIRAGRVKPDVDLAIRALNAPLQAKELADGARILADTLGERIELPAGSRLTEPVGRLDERRTLGDLYTKVADKDATRTDAENLFRGMFEVIDDPEGKFRREIADDQVVVKTAADTYYVMPKQAVEELRSWFADTMEAHRGRGIPEKLTKAWRTQALNTTPTTPINNFLGNVVLALTGGAGPISLGRAVGASLGRGKWADLIPAIERGAGNAGATTAALEPGRGIFGGRNIASRGVRGYVNAHRTANVMAEDYGRLALWIKEATKDAKRQQFGPVMAKIRRANDETLEMIRTGKVDHEKIHDTVNDFFGDLYKRGKADRAWFLAVPFHRWFRHMVRLSLYTMPTKYPKRAAFLLELGQIGEDYRKEHGVFPDWMRGVILTGTELVGPIAGDDMKNRVQHGIATTGFNPFSSVTQFLGGGVAGGVNPITVSVASLLGEKHVEDFANLSSSIYGDESAQVRDLKDAQGNPITRGSREWFRAGAHEIAGMVPIVSKAFPSSGRDDSYLPGYDDDLPLLGRLGPEDDAGHSLHERTYKAPSEGGGPSITLPAWLEPAEADRGALAGVGRFFGKRDVPFNVGGPAFQISALKQFQNAQRRSSMQGKIKSKRPPDPKP